jgi:hypothetical protein
MRALPWHLKGVHREVRDVAHEAARRSGVSVGAWLNSLIMAAEAEVPPPEVHAQFQRGATPATRHPRRTWRASDDHIAKIVRQIDELKWWIEGRSHGDSALHASAAAEVMRSIRLEETMARSVREVGYPNEMRAPFGNKRGASSLAKRNKGSRPSPGPPNIAGAAGKHLDEIANSPKSAVLAGALPSLKQEVRALGERIEANDVLLRDRPLPAASLAPQALRSSNRGKQAITRRPLKCL